ncbi:MAG: (Fe-S)-binding protein [archaeon]|nr:(Fe-S)-binding protein [archaeon]MCP8320407.1 (Fe-S)-binding protein [archaeon]
MKSERVTVSIDELTATQVIELETCVRCGACANSCPVYLEDKNVLAIPALKLNELRYLVNKERSILSIIFRPRPVKAERLEEISKQSYRCTLCGRCMTGCVFGIQNRELREVLRSILYRSGYLPTPLKKIATSLSEKMNPFEANAEKRLRWIEQTGLKEVPIKERADTVFFVGCSSAFLELNQRIAFATASILNHVKENWTLLGDEWCCGNPWIAIGDQRKAQEFARHNTYLIESMGAKRVITSCAACYKMLKWKYPQIIRHQPRFEVLHFTEFLSRCIRDGQIQFSEKVRGRVTYHDPCELSRLGGVVEEPRYVLKRLTDKFLEMPENRMDTYCCGGGGFLKEIDDELRLKIGTTRIKHAEKTQAEILTSACPTCKITLIDSAKEARSDVKILDLAELVAEQMRII